MNRTQLIAGCGLSFFAGLGQCNDLKTRLHSPIFKQDTSVANCHRPKS